MKAVLVAVQLAGVEQEEVEASLAELKRLVETLGFEVIGQLTQKRHSPSPSTIIGIGKLKELAQWTGGKGVVDDEAHEDTEEEFPQIPDDVVGQADKVVFDHELTPNQLRNLEKATDVEVLDRTGVIIEIFHRHAKTREARLQVEIARLHYLTPRIRATGGGERQGGGIGSKGAGETAHELDRRRIRDRVAELQAELKLIGEDQSNRRSRRRDQRRVALIGYTNAGKSSLMRALTGSKVLVADKLFATLDTTIRAMHPDTFPRILISDTVGFIKKLPHDLVASFRSTLDEAGEASLLLYVVDSADLDFRAQLEVTRTVVSEIEAGDIPSILVLNKSDCLDIAQKHLLKREFPDAMMVSALNPEDVLKVQKRIRAFFETALQEAEFLVPYNDDKHLVGEIRRGATVVDEKYDETGARFTIKAPPEFLAKLRKLLPETVRTAPAPVAAVAKKAAAKPPAKPVVKKAAKKPANKPVKKVAKKKTAKKAAKKPAKKKPAPKKRK